LSKINVRLSYLANIFTHLSVGCAPSAVFRFWTNFFILKLQGLKAKIRPHFKIFDPPCKN